MTEILDAAALNELRPERVFDGADLDCGSGLILLIRENMLQIPVGEILEMRTREPTVNDDLPPWCRMSGHEYLGRLEGDGYARYFMRRGEPKTAAGAPPSDDQALAEDKKKAMDYEWRMRVRSTGNLKSTVYCRNFSWDLGQPASFKDKDAHPCAVEALLGALGGALSSGFATDCAREGLDVDDIEITVRGKLRNILAHMGLEPGDPSFASIEVKCFASTMDNENKVRSTWEQTVARSPIAATLAKAVDLNIKFAVV
ncbi:TusA-related sulfurtransferase [Desulfonatronum thiosulfatophilum]|uniref:TusA-related sulfurtransferase n=1 Tax=Desulfonatronum thiosulfatophilum TaxID=617002 RepID=A0A1G6DVX0_9BACT|nr:OsmC family protein [Desulfonatronum thiosulfatophilum]SDB49337.1 TusA-related sulfurtransferase [Desulfonatronum thiosulfatophilum]